MGNECYSKRKTKTNEVEQSMLQQINQIRGTPQEQYWKYQDKSLIDLLKYVNVMQKQMDENNHVSEYSEERKSYLQIEEVPPLQQEFNLLIDLIQKRNDYQENPLEDWINILDEKQSKPPCLRVFLKQMEINGNKLNATRSEFIVPCKPLDFIQYMGDFKAQKELDLRIDQFFPISQNPEQRESKIYLSYKKMMMISARDFIYHKKTKQIDEIKEIWCDASKSTTDAKYPVTQKVRGDILISGYVIQPLANVIDEDYYRERFSHISFKVASFSFVKMYSECDFRMSVPLFAAKGQVSSEMQKYISAVYKALQ